jgi:hypothetical protein
VMPERLLDLECAGAGPLAGDGAQPVLRVAISSMTRCMS